MTFFRRLKAAWQYLSYMPYEDYADHEDFWREEDSRTVQHFWNSPTGQKLRTKCNNLVVRSAVNATRDATNPVYRNGYAAGVAATFTWLDQYLPKQQLAMPRQEKDAMTAEELIEKYAP
jgi:hypothetical protein